VDAELEQQLLQFPGQPGAVRRVLDGDRIAADAVDAAVTLEQGHEERALQAGPSLPDHLRDELGRRLVPDERSQGAGPQVVEALDVELEDGLARAAQDALVAVPRAADESVVGVQDVLEVLLVGVVEACTLLRRKALRHPPAQQHAQLHLNGHGDRSGPRIAGEAHHVARLDLVEAEPLEDWHSGLWDQAEHGVVVAAGQAVPTGGGELLDRVNAGVEDLRDPDGLAVLVQYFEVGIGLGVSWQ
jgi:hypothetical protein